MRDFYFCHSHIEIIRHTNLYRRTSPVLKLEAYLVPMTGEENKILCAYSFWDLKNEHDSYFSHSNCFEVKTTYLYFPIICF